MRFITVLAAAAAVASSVAAFEFRAYTGADQSGSVKTINNPGKLTGDYNSYIWRGTRSGYCVRICNGGTSLGWRCDDYSNNNIKFTRAIVCGWQATCDC